MRSRRRHFLDEKEELRQQRRQAMAMWDRVYQDCLNGKIDTEAISAAMMVLNAVDSRILNSHYVDVLREDL